MEKFISVAPLYRGALEHSGISGMKWGKRRYRNYDGTLTEEGKERYYPNYHPDYVKAHSGKKAQYMSDDELIKAVNRIQREQQYNSATIPKKKDPVKIAKRILEIGGLIVAADVMYGKLSGVGTKWVDKVSGMLSQKVGEVLGDVSSIGDSFTRLD